MARGGPGSAAAAGRWGGGGLTEGRRRAPPRAAISMLRCRRCGSLPCAGMGWGRVRYSSKSAQINTLLKWRFDFFNQDTQPVPLSRGEETVIDDLVMINRWINNIMY